MSCSAYSIYSIFKEYSKQPLGFVWLNRKWMFSTVCRFFSCNISNKVILRQWSRVVPFGVLLQSHPSAFVYNCIDWRVKKKTITWRIYLPEKWLSCIVLMKEGKRTASLGLFSPMLSCGGTVYHFATLHQEWWILRAFFYSTLISQHTKKHLHLLVLCRSLHQNSHSTVWCWITVCVSEWGETVCHKSL